MTVYWFILVWTVIMAIVSKITSKSVLVGENLYEERSNYLVAILTFAVIIVFVGLRSGVLDTSVYISSFENYPDDFSNDVYDLVFRDGERAPGFVLFTLIMKCFISTDYHVWLFTIAFISSICVMYTIKKYSCNFGISAYLFIASCQFTWLLNGIRQFLVAAILFACTFFILKKRPIPYIIIVLILSSFHTSALIMIPAYFIVESEPWSKKTMLFIGIIVLAMLFTSQFTSILDTVVENSDYASSMHEFKDTDDGTSVIRILVESIPIILAFIYRKKIKDKLTPIIKISINMSLISSGLYIISKVAKSGIMLGRLPIYFSLYNLILLPWLLNNIFEKKEKRLVYYTMIICYLGFFYFQMCVAWGGLEYVSDVLNLRY